MYIYIYIYLLDHLLFFTPILKYFTIVLSNNWYVKHYFLFFTFFFYFIFVVILFPHIPGSVSVMILQYILSSS